MGRRINREFTLRKELPGLGKRTYKAWRWLFFSILMVSTFRYIPNTYSMFNASATVQPVNFRAAHINDFIKISPGSAEASYYREVMKKQNAVPAQVNKTQQDQPKEAEVSKEKFSKPVASADEKGKVTLNFGVLHKQESQSFKSVLLVHNIEGQGLIVNWRMEGGIVAQLQKNGGAMQLEKNEAKGLNIGFTANASRGEYQGSLVINVNGEFLTIKIPVKVIVQ